MMPILIALAVAALVLVIFVPSWYTRKILDKYSTEADYLPGTGGELAQHFIKRLQLPTSLERTEHGDHYDPTARTVRLTDRVMEHRSLTAVAVAAHEVGHAMQHESGSKMLALRTYLVRLLRPMELLASVLFMVAPPMMIWSPRLGLVLMVAAFVSLLFRVVVHLVTLPVEFDASFGKALPLLQLGKYLRSEDEEIVRKILKACAMTYVSSALMELLNVFRWLRFFRR